MHISELANRHVDISIHALHEESEIDLDKQGKATVFQSTLSMRRAIDTTLLLNQFFTISIHALHEESDRRGAGESGARHYFNPRSP